MLSLSNISSVYIYGMSTNHSTKGGKRMIDYSPFWRTLKESKENWYTLTKKHHISDSTLHRLKHNRDISMKTINDLCRILNCNIDDIAVYVPSDQDQIL